MRGSLFLLAVLVGTAMVEEQYDVVSWVFVAFGAVLLFVGGFLVYRDFTAWPKPH